MFEDNNTLLAYETLTVDANDTSVILVAEGANLDLSYVDVIKYGYSSNLDDASFWGFNAAVNVVSFRCLLNYHTQSCPAEVKSPMGVPLEQ